MTRRRMCISGPSPLRGGGKEGGSMNDEQARIGRGGLLMPRRPSRIVIVLAAVFCALAGPAGAQLASLSHERGAAGLGLALRRLPVGARVLYVTAHPDDEHNGVLVRLARGLGVRTALLTVTRGDGGQNYIGPELFDALAVLRTEELLAIHRYDGVEQFFGRASDFGFSFRVAADPARFPEQIRAGLRPWQACKIYQGGTGGFGEKIEGTPVRVPTGVADPLLGFT